MIRLQWTYYLCFIGLLLTGLGARAQVEVRVITKTIERAFDYEQGGSVLIRGEKAAIVVHAWGEDEVKVRLKLTAKAVSEADARKELEYQKYILDQRKGVISLSNYYQVPERNQPLKSILLAEYEVWLPLSSQLTINNNYGNIVISGKQGVTLVTNRFGNITLNQVGGKGTYRSYFGDFVANDLSGENELKFNKTTTIIRGLSGKLSAEAKLGDLTLDHLEGILSLDIKASKSDVHLESVASWENYNYKFRAEFGDVLLQGDFPESPKETGNVTSWTFSSSGNPTISIGTNFGTISLTTR